jgi:hypothetical protein
LHVAGDEGRRRYRDVTGGRELLTYMLGDRATIEPAIELILIP